MKKYLILCLFCFSFYIQTIEYGYAWNDGNKIYPYVIHYNDYNYNIHYDTNDWIGDAVITIICNNSAKMFFLNNMKIIFFVGTESPQNSNIKMILDNEEIYGENESSLITIEITNTNITYDLLHSKLELYSNLAIKALQNEQYTLATYYFGMICTYISYIFYFPIYIINSISFKNYTTRLNEIISKYTSNYKNATWFFTWNLSHRIKNTTLDILYSKLRYLVFNHTITPFWLKTNINTISLPNTKNELSNYSPNSSTFLFFSYYQYIFNEMIEFISNYLYTLFSISKARGGNIPMPTLFSQMEKKTIYIIIGIFVILVIILFYPIYRKIYGPINFSIFKKRKVIDYT